MHRAFVLGAGLGTRLRPLTGQLPKPLIPVHHRPLIAYAFAHLREAGVREFVVNTHHLPEAFAQAFPGHTALGCPITFRHEPVLLETGGGIANVADLLRGEPFFVYNGDVLTDVPLAPALDQHRRDGNAVTLILRRCGPVKNVALDVATGRVIDVRNALGTNHPDQFQFTGIYLVEPDFLRWLPEPGAVETVVAAWMRALAAGVRIGGAVIDEGWWFDLGDRASYLSAHETVKRHAFPAFAPLKPDDMAPVHSLAQVAPDAVVSEFSSVGPGCVVGAGAVVRNSILWPGARVAEGACLTNCIVTRGRTVHGVMENADV